MNNRIRLLLVIGGIGTFVAACLVVALFLGRTDPDHRLVSSQGMMRLIVTSERIAADDKKLLQIADMYLRRSPGGAGRRAVSLQVWTDRLQVPQRLENMTDAQASARRASVWINETTSLRKVER